MVASGTSGVLRAPHEGGTSALRGRDRGGAMTKRGITIVTLVAVAMVALGATSAFAGGGARLDLYLVNSGPETRFYNDSLAADGNCDPVPTKPASLSLTPGASL